MFCTTECWDCEDKTCKHYISKSQLYFENQQLCNEIDIWNDKYNAVDRDRKKYKSVLDEIREVLNNQMDYREFVDMINAIEEILDKVKE